MEKIIHDIKNDFRSEISSNDPKVKRLQKVKGELFLLTNQTQMFEMSKRENAAWNKKLEKLSKESKKFEAEIREIKDNKIYENAFEWRFEFPEVLDDNGDYVGFDVVIGNPPYVGLQSMSTDSHALSKLGYSTYNKTGDLYVLFCEKGNHIIKQNGNLSFIIPNKWMSAGYGKNLRNFLLENTNPTKIIDFQKVFVFDEAVVFVCILEFKKECFKDQLRAVTIKNKGQLLNFETVFNEDSIKLNNLDNSGWDIADASSSLINEKMERIGTPLKNWEGIGFFRGLTTGYNSAFVIDKKESENIIQHEPQSQKLIKHLLRGRNIKRFKYEYDNIHMLFIPWHFPLQDDISITNSSEIAEIKFQEEYPIAYKHLLKYEKELRNRNKAETGIRYEWYALQRYGASYSHLFEEDKIIWMEISDKANYAYDENRMYLTNSAYFITGHSLQYLLAILNSKLCDFYFFQKTAKIAGGRKRYTKQYVEQNPIPILSQEEQKPFIHWVEKILESKKENPAADTSSLEAEIDQLVYRLYGLTEEEIGIVEGS
jgi:hypothetical protein